MATPIITTDRWVIKNIDMHVNYEKRIESPETGSRDQKTETVYLYATRYYTATVYMYQKLEDPSIKAIMQHLFMIVPGGTGVQIKLPSLDSSGQGVVNVINPEGGEWLVKGWITAFDEVAERWMTSVKIAGSWNYKIGLKKYVVQNW